MRNVKNRRSFLAGACALAASCIATRQVLAADLPGKGIVVQPIGLSTPTARFQDVIVEKGLQQLGYTIKEYIPADPAVFHLAISQGEATFSAQEWTPLYDDYYQKSGGDAVFERLGHTVTNCVFGYCIDKATADKYKITNIGQLRNPKIAALFNSNGVDGKADLVAGNPGWGAAKVIRRHLDLYGLTSTVRPDFGNYEALMADVIARFKAGNPVLYYTWLPMWVSDVLVPDKDVVWLSVPAPDPAAGQSNGRPPEGRDTGFPIYEMKILVNKKFAAQNPAARKFFELLTIPAGDVSAENLLMQKGENKIADVQRHAQNWIAAHQTQYADWIRQSTAAGRA